MSTFVCYAPAITRGAVPSSSVKITRGVVSRFGLSVTQPGGDITILSSHTRLPTPDACQLVGPGICSVLGSLGTVFGGNLAVVDGLGAIVRRPSAPRSGLVAFVCLMLTVGRSTVTCGSVKIARRVIPRFGFSVAQSGRHVTVLCCQARLPATHSCQLVGAGILAILSRLGAILGRNPAVIDSLGAVVRSLGVPGWSLGTFAIRFLTPARRPVQCRSVEVTRRVIARSGLSVTPFGIPVTHVRGQIAVAPFYVTLACHCQGVLVFFRQSATSWAHHQNNCSNRAGTPGSISAPRRGAGSRGAGASWGG